MDEQHIVARNLAQQREWYGEPLGDRVRRLVVAFDVSQAHLADVLGVSPPMLSQLMSGRRAKIGNPAVLARMVMLERRVLTPEVASGDPAAIRDALIQVRDSRPTMGRDTLLVEEDTNHAAIRVLRGLAGADELTAAAVLLEEFPALAGLLLRAAEPDPDGPDGARTGALPGTDR